jgi:hypothetical protein
MVKWSSIRPACLCGRQRRSHRKCHRRPRHKCFRRGHRPGFRVRWRVPDDLGMALTAYRRAIRAHRRLARLAPHQFDAAVVDRDRLEHQERLRWQAIWEPAIEKVYGTPTPAEREARRHADWLASQPPRLAPATQRAVERYHVDWEFWMTAGKLAWDRYQRRRSHGLVSLSRLARVLDIAVAFGRLATGLDSNQPPFEPHNDEAAWADLRRAYGHLNPPPAPAVSTPPPASPSPPRRNAYSRLARQLRQLKGERK